MGSMGMVGVVLAGTVPGEPYEASLSSRLTQCRRFANRVAGALQGTFYAR